MPLRKDESLNTTWPKEGYTLPMVRPASCETRPDIACPDNATRHTETGAPRPSLLLETGALQPGQDYEAMRTARLIVYVFATFVIIMGGLMVWGNHHLDAVVTCIQELVRR